MTKTFKLKKKQLSKFFSYLGHKKEYGGNIKIHNGYARIVYEKKGDNYRVRMNFQGEYDISYHTHAYLATLQYDMNTIFEIIKNALLKSMNNGLYLFEANVMKIHPPSPQDCKLCSIQRKTLVFTQEGVYFMKYKTGTILSNKDVIDIKNVYYKCMWGTSEQNVKKHISSNDPIKIMKILRICHDNRRVVSYKKSILEYMKYLQTKNLDCKLIPWNRVQNHIFTL